ncbi:MAG: hypothetical protein M3R38_18340 [Actinomycetota bacterium]|nr:hypothetical protein [Actinomycetota bacterium]
MLGRLFGSGSGHAPGNEVWDKLVAESGPGIREAGGVISGIIDRAGGLSAAASEARFPAREVDRPLEEIISGAERELEELCGRYDYRQLLFLSRLCTGVPLLRDADADMAAVRVRVQNADRWILRCGNRSSPQDFMRIENGGISIGASPEPIFRDAVKLHWLANFHQWRVIDRAMFNFVRLVSQKNGLPEPHLLLLMGGGVGREWGSPETWASVNLYAHRYRSQNGDLAWWAMGDAEPNGEPFTLMYGYSPHVTSGPYAGGELFVPVPLWLGAMTEYGKRFRPIFEREDAVGMPPEHLRAISRGLSRLVMDAAEDPEWAPWVALTGSLAVPRNLLLGAPLKEAARGYLTSADPDRAADADLDRNVERFVALASSSPDAVPGHEREASSSPDSDAPERGRERDAASARTLGYPYMIHGGPDHDLWVVDYLNTLPFFQGLAGQMNFLPAKQAFARTSMFDALLAEAMEHVPGIEPVFVDDREEPDLPNVKFYFDGGSKNREIDVPLRRGRVLIAVQTWARNLDLRISEGHYGAMQRRWDDAKKKLRKTDKKYTDYLLRHAEGKRRMEEEGLRYILPILCGPFTEPVVSLDQALWLRPLSTRSYDEALESLPRMLSPAELERFLSTASEGELREICERNRWEIRDDG